MVFPGVQKTTWTYDKVAKAYYFHRFYEHQPDLNIDNPAVREEIEKIMGFWLQPEEHHDPHGRAPVVGEQLLHEHHLDRRAGERDEAGEGEQRELGRAWCSSTMRRRLWR